MNDSKDGVKGAQSPVCVGVYPDRQLQDREQLFSALGRVYDVEFVPWSDESKYAGVIIFGDVSVAPRFTESTNYCFVFPSDGNVEIEGPVTFGSSESLPKWLRNRSLPEHGSNNCSHLDPGCGTILARKGQHILWTRTAQGQSLVDAVAVPPPTIGNGAYLFEYFSKQNWFSLLPVLHFLQELTGWAKPPLRACFMFDDPNLHWTSYGHLDFAQVAENAERYRYHVAFATIPLDAWLVHPKAAAIFRQNKKRLSLLCHGNNHAARELSQDYTEAERLALLKQALHRIESLERRSGVEISRVMAAPHGACSELMMRDLGRIGFEAACISHGSLRTHNAERDWTRTIGLTTSEVIAGLPVIPRFRISKTGQTQILLAAFLGQPIIPVGHHDDVSDGLDLLEELAGFINSLGEVHWMDMKSIARSNYIARQIRDVLELRMYSRYLRIRIPENVTTLSVERPWLADESSEELIVTSGRTFGAFAINDFGHSIICVAPGTEVEIHSVSRDLIERDSVLRFRIQPWLVVRRQLAACRDRIRPFIEPRKRRVLSSSDSLLSPTPHLKGEKI